MKILVYYFGSAFAILLIFSLIAFVFASDERRFATPQQDSWANLQEKDFIHVRAEIVKISGQSFLRVRSDDWNMNKSVTNVIENVKETTLWK